MNIRKITDGIYYVGVNDRVTDRFEGLWPLPQGVSYNSYIVKGKTKTALIDTVEIGSVRNFIRSIYSEIGDSRIDYLVINHMEPDHSGGIPMVLSHFPELKIVGNKQTIAMIKGFFHIEDESRFMEIADGATIDLGEKSLRFIMTPMVHWPETMMTYVEENGVIFSGDAFGCFGALNGGIVDDEMNVDWYWDEMYRYYSNIVGKYGRFVQKALEKTSPLKIDFLCPTHGPVWHEHINRVVDIYNRLSKYESEPGVTIIFGSMYGNTGEIAEAIARQLAAKGVKNIKIHNAAKENLSSMISDAFRYEGLIVGGPTYSMHLFPPVEEFMIAMETRELKNKVVATFGSFTWASAAAKTLKEYLQKMKIEPVASLEMKHAASSDTYAEIEKLAEKVVEALKLN
ncbi:MAG: FprA family A-type flavoprotein [Muribaculaceae bacterium]|nr:FprA family A-type flavoprotein [Muribaculaceae bacterium]